MKKKLFSVLVVLVVFAGVSLTQAQEGVTWNAPTFEHESDDITSSIDQVFYLYNVGSDAYLTYGGNYGTRAVMGPVGYPMYLKASESNYKFQFVNSPKPEATIHYLFYTNGNVFTDNSTNADWTVTYDVASKAYTIANTASAETFMVANTAETNNGNAGNGILNGGKDHHIMANSTTNDDYAKWRFVTPLKKAQLELSKLFRFVESNVLSVTLDSYIATYNSATTVAELNTAIAALRTDIFALGTVAEPLNVTGIAIANSSFEFKEVGSLDGWRVNPGQLKNQNSAEINGTYPEAEKTFVECWQNSGNRPAFTLQQTLKSLPAGVYSLKAIIKAQNNGSTTPSDLNLVAGSKTTAFSFDDETNVVKIKEVEVADIVLLDAENNLNIGVQYTTGANWIAIDYFRLYYKGVDLSALLDILQDQVTDAETTYPAGTKMQGTVAGDLASAINAAQALIDNPGSATQLSIQNAATTLTAATNAASASVADYAGLNAYIAEVTAIAATYPDGEAKTAINNAITAAQGVYDDATADKAGIEVAKAAIRNNIILASDNGEVTSHVIVNPNFDNNNDGWTITGTFGRFDGANTQYNGWNSIYETAPATNWVLDAGSIGATASQTIENMPAGTYVLKAVARGQNAVNLDNIVIFAGDQTVTAIRQGDTGGELNYGWARYTTPDFVLATDGALSLGVRLEGGTANGWESLDQFQLFYYSQGYYTVSFNSNGGGAIASQIIGVSGDKKVTKPIDPTKENDIFRGWYTDVELNTAWNFDTYEVTENIVLYAKWDIKVGVSSSLENDAIIKTEYYNLQGQKTAQPIENGIYLMKKIYTSGKTEVVKAVYKN